MGHRCNDHTSTNVESATNYDTRYRCFRLSFRSTDPRVESVIRGLESHRGLTEWAYIRHDRDEGVDEHYHFTIRCGTTRSIRDIAHYLGVPESSVLVLGGRGAFPRQLRYMVHEEDARDPYPRSSMVANFEWEPLVDALAAPARPRPNVDAIASALLTGDTTLADVYREHPHILEKHHTRLRRAADAGAEVRRDLDAAARADAAAEAHAAELAAAAAKLVEKAKRERELLDEARARYDAPDAVAERQATAEWLAAESAWLNTDAGIQYRDDRAAAKERARPDYRDRLAAAVAVTHEITGGKATIERELARRIRVSEDHSVVAWVFDDGELDLSDDAEGIEMLEVAFEELRNADLIQIDYQYWNDYEPAPRNYDREMLNELDGFIRQTSNDQLFGESHAVDGSKDGFQRAMNARQTMADYPSLFDAPPPPDKDIRRAWRDELMNVGGGAAA